MSGTARACFVQCLRTRWPRLWKGLNAGLEGEKPTGLGFMGIKAGTRYRR